MGKVRLLLAFVSVHVLIKRIPQKYISNEHKQALPNKNTQTLTLDRNAEKNSVFAIQIHFRIIDIDQP